MERISFISHRGKEIMFLDLSNCSVEEFFKTIDIAKKIIRLQSKNSVLTLTNVSGSRYTREVIEAMKEFVNGNKPYVKAGAVIGIDGLKKIIYDAIIKFSGRNLPAFNDIEEAKNWLVRQ